MNSFLFSKTKINRTMASVPEVKVNNDNTNGKIRRDIDSDDMRRVHPEVTRQKTPQELRAHLARCDAKAYETIRHQFPQFTPPHH